MVTNSKSSKPTANMASSEYSTSQVDDAVPQPRVVDSFMSMRSRYITVIVLFIVNLLNYMDRYTIAGVLERVKTFYKIDNGQAGLLQAAFIIGYMVFSPIFGYCGDRYNRKHLMVGGILFWSAITLSSSFVPSEDFALLVVLRALVGLGEASYNTIAPTIISDMFVQSQRSAALMFFYFAIPVGRQYEIKKKCLFYTTLCSIDSKRVVFSSMVSYPALHILAEIALLYPEYVMALCGLGYIVGSEVAQATDHWYWALRVTPGLGVICCILILVVSKEPPRGMAEHSTLTENTNIWKDILALCKNKSFMLNTFGFVCVAFVAGALALFAPSFVYEGYLIQGITTSTSASVSFYFGLLTCGAGFLGILCGASLAHLVKKKYPSGDAFVCAFGLMTSSIFLFFSIFTLEYSVNAAWVLMFIGMTLVCMNWSLAADILLYTVVPTRRSAAEAYMNFVGHLLGDAGSPYLLGTLSDYLNYHNHLKKFKAMQFSLYTCALVAMVGGSLYVACSFFIPKDRARADAISHGASEQEVDARNLVASGPPEETTDEDAPLIYS